MPQKKALVVAGSLTALVVAVVLVTGAQLGAFGLGDAERAARQEVAAVAGVSETLPVGADMAVPEAIATVLPVEESALALAGMPNADEPLLYFDDDDDRDDDAWDGDDDDRDEHRERVDRSGRESEYRDRAYDVRREERRSDVAGSLSFRRSEGEHDDDD